MSFTLGGDDDTKTRKFVLKALRHTAKLGRDAEKALQDLRRDGFITSPVTYVKAEGNGYSSGNFGKNSGIVYTTSLPPILSPTRDFSPNLQCVSAELKKEESGSNGGSTFQAFPVRLTGEKVVWDGVNPVRLEPLDCEFGRVRTPKSGISWEPKNGYIVQLYQEFRYASAKEALGDLARHMSYVIVESEDATKRDLAFSRALRLKVAEWLVEDGVSERIMRAMRDQAKVWSVMTA